MMSFRDTAELRSSDVAIVWLCWFVCWWELCCGEPGDACVPTDLVDLAADSGKSSRSSWSVEEGFCVGAFNIYVVEVFKLQREEGYFVLINE